jgi:hypothetical protein
MMNNGHFVVRQGGIMMHPIICRRTKERASSLLVYESADMPTPWVGENDFTYGQDCRRPYPVSMENRYDGGGEQHIKEA